MTFKKEIVSATAQVLLLVAIGLVLAVMAGCTGKTVLLKNDAGQVVRCEVGMGAAMIGGALLRNATIKNCVEQYETAGFKKLEARK